MSMEFVWEDEKVNNVKYFMPFNCTFKNGLKGKFYAMFIRSQLKEKKKKLLCALLRGYDVLSHMNQTWLRLQAAWVPSPKGISFIHVSLGNPSDVPQGSVGSPSNGEGVEHKRGKKSAFAT